MARQECNEQEYESSSPFFPLFSVFSVSHRLNLTRFHGNDFFFEINFDVWIHLAFGRTSSNINKFVIERFFQKLNHSASLSIIIIIYIEFGISSIPKFQRLKFHRVSTRRNRIISRIISKVEILSEAGNGAIPKN